MGLPFWANPWNWFHVGAYNTAIAKLNHQIKSKKITKNEFDRDVATLNEEPWVHGDLRGNPSDGFYFDMDWNDLFISYLKDNGIYGSSPEDMVDQWLVRMYTNELINGEMSNIENLDRTPATPTRLSNGKTEHR